MRCLLPLPCVNLESKFFGLFDVFYVIVVTSSLLIKNLDIFSQKNVRQFPAVNLQKFLDGRKELLRFRP